MRTVRRGSPGPKVTQLGGVRPRAGTVPPPPLIDLHLHTDRSDGSDTPERVVELAAAAGCRAIAITDHDRLDGVAPARGRGHDLGVEVVGGCELSCAAGNGDGTMHLLAYFVEDDEGPLRDALAELRTGRDDRNRRLVERLVALGLPVTYDELEEEAGGVGAGRPHAAAVLLRKGVVGSVQEAFDRWLAKGRPGYVPRVAFEPAASVRLVVDAGGVPVLAHPFSLDLHERELDAAVAALAAHGLGGIEAWYGRYRPDQRAALAALARRHDLVATGGSDYHGTYKPDLQVGTGRGDLDVPDDALTALEARRR